VAVRASRRNKEKEKKKKRKCMEGKGQHKG
jgi:hypothetical protein